MKSKKFFQILGMSVLMVASMSVFESCSSGGRSGTRVKHCSGKKTKNTQRIKRMAPGMAR